MLRDTLGSIPEAVPRMFHRQILFIALIAAPLCGVAAHAGAGFTAGGDVAVTNASGHGGSYDFGLDTGYRFDCGLGLRLSYASLTHYEMTIVSGSATMHHAIADRWQLIGQLGVAYWTESPTGYDGSGEAPLLGIGLSYALAPSSSLRLQYQLVPGAGSRLGANLDTVMLGLQHRF